MDTELVKQLPIEEVAFMIWAQGMGNRRPKRVVAVLTQYGLNDGSITEQTIIDWAKANEWAIRSRELLDQLVPDKQYQAWATIMQAAEAGADYMLNVVQGNYWPEFSEQELLAMKPDDPRLNPNLVKVRTQAAKEVMYIGGMSPNRSNDLNRPDNPFHKLNSEDLKNKSIAELLEMEQEQQMRVVEDNQARAVHARNRGKGIRS